MEVSAPDVATAIETRSGRRWIWRTTALLGAVVGCTIIALLAFQSDRLPRAVRESGGSMSRKVRKVNPYAILGRGDVMQRDTAINLYGPGIDDDWISAHLSELQREETLKLRLTDVAITPVGYRALASCPGFHYLRVRGGAFDRECLEALSSAPFLPSVEFLGTQLRDRDLDVLAKFPHCWYVSLDRSLVTPEGIRHLSALPSLHALEIRDADDAAVALASQLTGLRSLTLFGLKVSDACIPSLASLTGLDHIEFYGTGLTGNGESTLNKQFPSGRIHSMSVTHPEWPKDITELESW